MSDRDSLADLLAARFGAAFDVPADLDADERLRGLAAHRSHRAFAERPVPGAVLDTVLACALSAPSKSDLQQVAVLRVADPERRARIAALIPSMPWIGTAPELLVLCGDNRRIRRICELRGRPFGNDHLDSFFNATVDAALVLMGCIVAAQAAGLGCCPVSAVRSHAREISDLLGLPRHVFPVAGLALGYPAATPPLSPRLPPSVTVHTDRYDDGGLDAALEDYDRLRTAARPPGASDRQRAEARFGRSPRYGWSEDKARQVAVTEREDFGRYVRDQGFDLE